MVVIDTNIIIDHLRQTQKNSLLKKLQQTTTEKIAISIISVQELFTGKSTKKKTNTNILLSIINSLDILPYTYQIAKLAGQINRDLDCPIEFADTAIAATTIYHQSLLFTLNQKHFRNIPRLKLFQF